MAIKEYRLKTFIDNELREFSNYDNVRSIPSIIDGLKDAQRKAVFGMMKHGNSEIKVAQLGNYVAKESHYAHGEVSMCDTIVGLAQDFPGSNNMNIFEPIGQFGSILSSEASAHRYIYTKPSSNLRKLFSESDDLILESQTVDGDKVEPVNYLPIIPLWIINGCEGIGTGHATKILPRNPKLIAQLISRLVNNVTPQQRTIDEAMKPHFDGWSGEVIKAAGDNQWELHGKIDTINTTTLRVTELPITYSIDKYKEVLIKLMDEGKVKTYDNDSSEDGFDITITVPREVGRLSNVELKDMFKLVRTITENVTLWNVSGALIRYDSAYDALNEFIAYRIDKYEVRRNALIDAINEKLDAVNNRIKFIHYWNDQYEAPKTRHEIELEIKDTIDSRYFDSLFAMQIGSLTIERLNALNSERKKLNLQLNEYKNTNPVNMYQGELNTI